MSQSATATNQSNGARKLKGYKWGICPSCGKERQYRKGLMLIHNRWVAHLRRMEHCPGSFKPAIPVEI